MNTGKKLRRTVAICVMAALIGPAGALADAVTVTAERLNVRTEASAQSKSVAVVSKDEKLQFVSASGDWIRVMASGKAGYVMKSFVSLDQASIASDVAASQTTWSQAKSATAAVRVNLRSLPMTNAEIVKVIDRGETISLTGECGDWYLAQYGGKSGYVMKDYVQTGASSVTPTPGSSDGSGYATPTTGVTNTRVNLRADASTGSKVIKILEKGTTVSLSGLNGSWYKATAGGVTGYISRQFVNTNSAVPTPTQTDEAETAYATPVSGTTNSRVNLRAKADTRSDIVKVIDKNSVVTLTGEKGAWYKATSDGKTGYLYKQYVMAGGTVTPTATPAPTATPVPQPTDNTAAAETTYASPVSAKANVRVNMRANASPTAALVKVIALNETVSVLGEKGDWYRITSDGKTGYAAKPYLTLQGAAATATPAPTASNYQSWAGVASVEVNMRKAPEGDVIYVLQAGAEVTVTGVNGSWYMVDYRGSSGYVASSYIIRKEDATPVVSPTDVPVATAPGQGTTAYVTGAFVNIRSGAGTGYGVVTTVRMGDQVTLYEQTGDWYRVSASGLTGYISAKYVSPNKPSETATPVSSDTIGKVINSDWWSGSISTIFKRGSIATVTDVDTGLSFQVKRTGGTNHADVQPLTSADTAIMYRIYGNKWQWTRRAIWVTVGGSTYAASMNGMPHGDSDSMPDNNFDGCFCIHFLNSRTHTGNRLDAAHQAAVAKALREGNK